MTFFIYSFDVMNHIDFSQCTHDYTVIFWSTAKFNWFVFCEGFRFMLMAYSITFLVTSLSGSGIMLFWSHKMS